MNDKKPKRRIRYLFRVLLILIIDVVAFFALVLLDSLFWSTQDTGHGHPLPVFAVVGILILLVITVIVVLQALIAFIVSLVRRNPPPPAPSAEKSVAEPLPQHRRKRWLPYLLIPCLTAAVSLVLVCLVGRWEIDSFYANPNNVGFAVPIVTFLLAGILFLITLVVSLVCLVLGLCKR